MASWNHERPYDALAEKSLRDSGRGHLSTRTSSPPPDLEPLNEEGGSPSSVELGVPPSSLSAPPPDPEPLNEEGHPAATSPACGDGVFSRRPSSLSDPEALNEGDAGTTADARHEASPSLNEGANPAGSTKSPAATGQGDRLPSPSLSAPPPDPEEDDGQLQLVGESFDEWMRRMRKVASENEGQA